MPTATHHAHGAHFAPTLATLAAAALCAAALAAKSHAQTWTNPAGGDWSNPANWSPTVVPTGTTPINLGLSGTYAVTLGANFSLASTLTIPNANSALVIPQGVTLTSLAATIQNEGQLVLNKAGPGQSRLIVSSSSSTAVLTGSGRLTLNAAEGLLDTATVLAGGRLLNDSLHTIEGTGILSGFVLNQGTIVANRPGRPLRATANLTNAGGLLAATSGGQLRIDGGRINQPSGRILADGPGSEVRFVGTTTVTEGRLQTSNGGVIALDATARVTLGSSTAPVLPPPANEGTLRLEPGAHLGIAGDFRNDGEIFITPGSNPPTLLDMPVSASITGTGTILLGDVPRSTLNSVGIGILGPHQTLRGAGLARVVTNQGRIVADDPRGPLGIEIRSKTPALRSPRGEQTCACSSADPGPCKTTRSARSWPETEPASSSRAPLTAAQ